VTSRKPQPKSKAQKPLSRVAKLAVAQKARDAADAGADDDLNAFVKSGAPDAPDDAPDGRGVRAAIADAAFAEALKGRGRLRARLAFGRPVAVIVAVADSSWVGAVDEAVRRAAPPVKVIARDGSLRGQHKQSNGNAEVALALADGRAVVGVASAPEAVLPSALVSCADARLDLAPPSGGALRGLLRRFARGPRRPRKSRARPRPQGGRGPRRRRPDPARPARILRRGEDVGRESCRGLQPLEGRRRRLRLARPGRLSGPCRTAGRRKNIFRMLFNMFTVRSLSRN